MKPVKVFLFFYKAIFASLFNSNDKKWRVAGQELLGKKTFRLPDSAYNDRLIGIRMLVRTIKNLRAQKRVLTGNAEILIADANQKVEELRKDYLKTVKDFNSESLFFLSKESSYAYAEAKKIKFYIFLLAILVIPATFFSKNRVQWALVFSEFSENCTLLSVASKMGVNKVHFFSPAEKDANLSYLLLNKIGVTVIKHPSPGALISHNKNLMTDTLAVSSRYQQEEFELMLKESISASNIELWPPEISYKYLNFYSSENRTFENKFGFYSHGGWLRVKDGKTKGLFASPEEEEKCLDILKELLSEFTNEKLIVFLHPKEKVSLNETKLYYQKWFRPEQVVFFEESVPSSKVFDKAEFGIGSYSTILFERDYFGFKTIVLNEVKKNFPLKGTTFYKNSFASFSELKEKINNYYQG